VKDLEAINTSCMTLLSACKFGFCVVTHSPNVHWETVFFMWLCPQGEKNLRSLFRNITERQKHLTYDLVNLNF